MGIRLKQAGWLGKTAIVTGASHGIGLVIAKFLARQGANLALISRTKPPPIVRGKLIEYDLAELEEIPGAIFSVRTSARFKTLFTG